MEIIILILECSGCDITFMPRISGTVNVLCNTDLCLQTNGFSLYQDVDQKNSLVKDDLVCVCRCAMTSSGSFSSNLPTQRASIF